MKSLNSKRRRSLKKFFTDLDRAVLFGTFDRKMRKIMWRERKEQIYIDELVKVINECIHCGGKGELRWEHNMEYPNGAFIQCQSCGMRTPQYVEFINLDKRDINSRVYSKAESVKRAIGIWNRRIK